MRLNRGVLNALTAAALFGASTPLAKTLVDEIPPVLLAGILYAGSGLGLAPGLLTRRLALGKARSKEFAWPRRADIGWLAGAIVFGGVLGPVLLMLGLTSSPASVTALLLNLEAVFTAALAWFVFHENFDRRIALGMVLIVVGGLVLSWSPGRLAMSVGVVLARQLWMKQNFSWQFNADVGPFVGSGRQGSSQVSVTKWDAIIGAKGQFAFGDKREWFVPYYIDVGTGQTQLTWQAIAGLGYAFSWGDLIAVWRYIDYRFKSADAFGSLTMNGPAVGAAFHW